MLNQEDSNGETASFEIIDKKNGESSNNESLSGVSSPYSIPSPPMTTSGNLLSNIPAPSSLAVGDFQLWQSQSGTPAISAPTPLPPNILAATKNEALATPVNAQPIITNPFPTTQFSAAIPPSKGVLHPGPASQASGSQDQNQGGSGSGFIGWMKDAVSSGGILSKVAEKAKNSVDTLITTLDPQMSEFIYSGGDLEIGVVSNNADEISAIREATFSIFGKAWVNGIDVKLEDKKHIPIGFEQGIKSAEDKLNRALQHNKIPTVALENILLSLNENWYDLSVLLLKDLDKKITLTSFTQMIPIPFEEFLKEAEKEMPVYFKECDSKEKVLAAYLQLKNNTWQQSVAAVTKKETIFLATKTLMALYKNKINSK